MKKSIGVTGILFFLTSFCLAQELTLDEIMQRYYVANNMEKLQEVNTIIMTGLRVQQDIMPLKIVRKRPDLYLLDFYVADLNAFQAYDGETAWVTSPWTGNAAPQVLQGSRERDMKYQSDFDGMLYRWKEKGHLLKLEGIDTLDTGEAYKIRLIRADSAIQYYFIDRKDFLLKKQLTYRTFRGEEIAIETYFRNYRDVDGIPFAFLLETSYAGRSVSNEIETIELNVPVEDDLFRMPQ
ncbi:MAG: hypothetical protein D4R67_01455 [Bacteroidetes bacterium]|nr:MAG: hypothetical protein D4R67_01455 [Bacteroidota bacterium]